MKRYLALGCLGLGLMVSPLLGGDGWDSPQIWDLGGESLNGSYISNHYSVDDPSPAIQDFVNRFKAKYNGTAPDALAALGYDAMMVLADAIEDLEEEGAEFDREMKVGMMVEVPSAVMMSSPIISFKTGFFSTEITCVLSAGKTMSPP